MVSKVTCPQCHAVLRIRESGDHKPRGKCPRCGSLIALQTPPSNSAGPTTASAARSSELPPDSPTPRHRWWHVLGLVGVVGIVGFGLGLGSERLVPWRTSKPEPMRAAVAPLAPKPELSPPEPDAPDDIADVSVERSQESPPKPVPPTFASTVTPISFEFSAERERTGKRPEWPQISGKWSGLYFSHSEFHALEIEWEEALLPVDPGISETDLHGYARLFKYHRPGLFQPLTPRNNRFELTFEGPAIARISRVTREVQILLTPKIDPKVRTRGQTHFLSGVLSESPPCFAGTLEFGAASIEESLQREKRAGYLPEYRVILAPQHEEEPTLPELGANVNLIITHVPLGSSRVQDHPRADPTTVKSIHRWALRFFEEYPKVSLRDTESHQLSLLTANLFMDEHFVPVFGARFDDLSPRQSEGIYWLIDDVIRSRQGAVPDARFLEYGPIARHFSLRGSNTRLPTLNCLWTRRVIRQWLKERQTWLDAVEPYPLVIVDLADQQRAFAQHLRELFPSEQNQERAIEATTEKVSPALVQAYVSELVARSPSPDTAAELLAWRSRSPAPVRVLSLGLKQDLEEVIQARLDLVLTQLLNAKLQTLTTLEDSRSTLDQLRQTDFDLRTEYSDFLEDARVRGLLSYLSALHARHVNLFREDLLQDIARAPSRPALRMIERSLDAIPDGVRPEDRQAFAALAEERRRHFALEEWKENFSPRELSLMDERLMIKVPQTCDPPTADEIPLAYVRSYAEVFGARSGPTSLEYDTKAPLPGADGRPMQIGRMSMRVLKAEILAPPTPLTGNPCAYRVRYRVRVQVEILGDALFDRDGHMTNAFNLLTRDIAGRTWSDPYTDEFLLTSEGWKSPTISQRVTNENPVMLGKALKSLENRPEAAKQAAPLAPPRPTEK